MPSRDELKALARTRLKEAEALSATQLYDGCSYLAGYVVELALKATICRHLDLTANPESGDWGKVFRTHRYDDLVRLAGLERKFDAARTANPGLMANWSILTTWSEQVRYQPVGSNPKARAQDMLRALADPNDGVFTWIKKRW